MTKTELTVEQLLALFEDMPIKQMNELVKAMEEKFGVSSQAVVVAGGAGGAGAAAVEEKSEFDVVIKSGGDKKIQVIKVVRDFTSLGLKEAKDLVDAGGKLLEGVSKEKAQEAKAKLEENGAVVEII